MNESRCIFCLELRDGADFNVEHVIPRAFGAFTNNFTLTDCVCRNCNAFFGNVLELFLARGSIEALRRFQYGVKPAEEVGELRKEVYFTIAAEGPWKGAYLVLKAEENMLRIDLVPQVGFRVEGKSERVFIRWQRP